MAWKYDGRERPPFAALPKEGQESVWDYPRPPALVPEKRLVVVRTYELVLAETTRALRVLETASPPTLYLPEEDLQGELLRPGRHSSYCEWKGTAVYYDLDAPWGAVSRVGWSYPEPTREFEMIAGYMAFYPAKLECYIDGERATPQPGGFYGGWMTSDIAGPVKGDPGTEGW